MHLKALPYYQAMVLEHFGDHLKARAIIDESGKDILLEIDGGVTKDNVEEIKAAGANVIVAGSAVFKAENMAEAIAQLKA